MQAKPIKYILGLGLVLLLAFLIVLGIAPSPPTGPLARVQLADGRILQVEGVTFGTRHQIGRRSLVERFEPWLPQRVNQFFAPRFPRSEINLEQPALVVWVNALNPTTGKHVDCQGIRVEFVDQAGDLFGEETSSWFGGTAFWRVGHVFRTFPRTQHTLTLQVTPWNTHAGVRLELPNPHITAFATWSGEPLPQQKRVGNLEVVLTELLMRTNGGPSKSWQTCSRYWEPIWELRQTGKPAVGWDAPEWVAEDPTGNRGQFVGVHQPVLRFSAEFYPSATNTEAALLLGRSPEATLASLHSNIWWNLELHAGTNEVVVLGLFPPGTYVFSEGRCETNPAIRFGATIGGAPSGWVGSSDRVSPYKVQFWDGHYTPVPVIYLRSPRLAASERLAIRLRDEQGRYWLTKPEPEGAREGIMPFMVDLPPEVKAIAAEIVLLKPVQAEFTVQIGEGGKR